jgi:hypothetical protein
METEPIRLSINEALVYAALINAAIGFVLGLVPLGFGFIRGQRRLGIFGILSATIGGALAGVFLSVPAMAIFTWLVVRRSRPDQPADPAEDDPLSGDE